MSKDQAIMDMDVPDMNVGKSVEEKLGMVSDFLFQLMEHQRYLFNNLDTRNFNPTGLANWENQITEPIYGRIADVAENVSAIVQKVNSITLSVANKETSSTITLKAGDTTIASQKIAMSGLVTFKALSQEGATTINGSNITTGTLSAESIKLRGKFAVYNGNEMGGYLGYMEGSTGEEITRGIGMCNIKSDCYVIATDAGVAVQCGGNRFFMTKTTNATFRCQVAVKGELSVSGIVRAKDFVKQ